MQVLVPEGLLVPRDPGYSRRSKVRVFPVQPLAQLAYLKLSLEPYPDPGSRPLGQLLRHDELAPAVMMPHPVHR
ncbi:hypothetical protein D3C87_1919270 [compost metagenome]